MILRGISFSQDNFQNNVLVVNNLIDESFTPVGNQLLILGKDKFYQVSYDVTDQESSYLVEQFRNKFRDFKLIINEDSDSINYKIVFSAIHIKTRYTKIFTDNLLGVKKVGREISVSYDLGLTQKDSNKILYTQNFNKKEKDSIDLDKLSNADDKRYEFSSSSIPEDSSIDQILFPAIIITISAAAIILFFSIRSK